MEKSLTAFLATSNHLWIIHSLKPTGFRLVAKTINSSPNHQSIDMSWILLVHYLFCNPVVDKTAGNAGFQGRSVTKELHRKPSAKRCMAGMASLRTLSKTHRPDKKILGTGRPEIPVLVSVWQEEEKEQYGTKKKNRSTTTGRCQRQRARGKALIKV